MKSITKKISFNSPAILIFVFISFISLVLGHITGGFTTKLLFSVYRSSLFNPLFYVRLFTHVLGHADFSHFSGNMMYILLIGPLLEEKYGTKRIVIIMALTAFITSLVNIAFFPDTSLLGASGVVFAFIILASITSSKDKGIPLTFIIVSVIYIGGQIIDGVFIRDNISNAAHIVGGIVGSISGYFMNKNV